MTNDGDGHSVKTSEAADDRGVITVTPVSVNLGKVLEKPLNEIERVWTIRMTSQLNALKRGHRILFCLFFGGHNQTVPAAAARGVTSKPPHLI